MNILIVENDETTAKLYSKVLEVAKHKTMVVAYPNQAALLLTNNKFDLVISDYLLDAHTADDVIDKVRQSTLNSKTKILILSANNRYLELMRNKGVFTYHKEDVNPKNLPELVAKVVLSKAPKQVNV